LVPAINFPAHVGLVCFTDGFIYQRNISLEALVPALIVWV
jgi:hypothetical protein